MASFLRWSMPHAQTSNTTEQDICAARGAGYSLWVQGAGRVQKGHAFYANISDYFILFLFCPFFLIIYFNPIIFLKIFFV